MRVMLAHAKAIFGSARIVNTVIIIFLLMFLYSKNKLPNIPKKKRNIFDYVKPSERRF